MFRDYLGINKTRFCYRIVIKAKKVAGRGEKDRIPCVDEGADVLVLDVYVTSAYSV
jgi:hypothetical protein